MRHRDRSRPSTWAVLRSAMRLIHDAGKRQLYTIIAATIVTSIAVAGQLLVGRNLLDLLTDDDHVSAGELGPYIIALGVLLMVSAISQSIANELRIPLSESVYRRTMDDILDVATEVEIEVYETSDFHDRLERAVAASLGRVSAVVFGVVAVISTLIVAAGVVAVLMTVAPILVPIAVLGYLPIAFVNARNNRASHKLEVEMVELQRNRYYLEDLMTSRDAAKELRAYGISPTLRRWHGALWDTRMERLRALVRTRLKLTTAGSAVTNVVLVITLAFAFVLAGRGSISVGDAAIAVVGLQQLSSRLQSTGAAFSGIHDGMIYLRDFEEFRSTLPEMRRLQPVGVPPSPPTAMRLDHIGYRYPGSADDAVRDVTLELRKGQILAIVGANGSGKTTLSKLICQLLPPARGAIYWDDVDLATCDRSLVRAQIAPVFQDYAQYQLTFRQSIGLGDVRRIDDDRVLTDAARRAGILDVIEAQPAGLDTRLGKSFSGGIDMSIGQWQRLAIARALLRDAPIMVLDEPSASLDPRGEAELFDLLHRAFDDRMVIFVSHRFATVRSADLILVMDQGDVVEVGDHDALIAAGGLYSELFNLQAERYGLGA